MDKKLILFSKLSDSLTILHYNLQELKNNFPDIETTEFYEEMKHELENLALLSRNMQNEDV